MSKEIKKGIQTPKQPTRPIDVPPLRERTEKASNQQKGEQRRPVMVTPIPTPPKKG